MMSQIGRSALIAGVFGVVAVTSLTAQTLAPQPPPAIVTTATGEAQVIPDRATIHFTVETRASAAAAAAAENAKKQTAVMDALKAMGLPKEQISTMGYSVMPEQRNDGKQVRVVGYVVRNTVRADLRRIDQVGATIDAALAAGANVVGSLRFMSSKIEEVRRQALADAVTRARADADVMARAAGGSLGALLELTSGGFTPYGQEVVMARAANMAADMATPIDPGEQTVRATVTVRWAFVSR
jgi:uncharacterized protein